MGITDHVKGAVEGAVGALNPLAKGESEEVRVDRAEEELDVTTAGREAGSVGVHKTVQTETEQVQVPVRREEVHVDRVPVGEPTDAAGIGGDEVRVQVYEEETVITKRPVVKEEVRIRKTGHTDVDTVTEDVRKEHVQIDRE